MAGPAVRNSRSTAVHFLNTVQYWQAFRLESQYVNVVNLYTCRPNTGVLNTHA